MAQLESFRSNAEAEKTEARKSYVCIDQGVREYRLHILSHSFPSLINCRDVKIKFLGYIEVKSIYQRHACL